MISNVKVNPRSRSSQVWVVYRGKVLPGAISRIKLASNQLEVELYGEVPGTRRYQHRYNCSVYTLDNNQIYRTENEAQEALQKGE